MTSRISATFIVFSAVALLAGGLALALVPQLAWSQTNADASARNKATIQKSFDAWAAGTGGPYDLLADDVQWTIVGRSAVAKTYPSREAFMSEVIRPFNARMRERLKPNVRGLYADGDVVIALFDASSIARDDVSYTNTYSWYLRMDRDRIVAATAFFDSIAFDEMWARVSPAAPTAVSQ